jgi:hypothetical protein
MRVLFASALIALLTASAFAQDATSGSTGGKRHGGRQAQSSGQPKKKVDDGAYKAALKGIPDQRPTDPWGSVRSGAK